jgi:23S rRNA pseudouridine2605 synthase
MPSDTPTQETPETDRIAKVMARSGICSRRDAEKMILEGRVAVNGKVIRSPALDVGPKDRVTLDGKPIDAPQETRLWLYYKPLGLVTSEKDEKGRQTVFDTLPAEMPRVMSVGRLDLNSEGLLLLTNDGGLKRRLELPETGWLRKYRVRVNGRPDAATFDPLRRGIVVDGEDFQPMEISLDRQQGANAWLTVGIREGRNREIRRAMEEVKLTVNRLIRVSYGPFRLNEMKPGDVVEVKRKVLREQLGERLLTGKEVEEARPARPARDAGEKRPFMRKPREDGERKPYAPREGGERKGFGDKPGFGDRKPYSGKPREDGERKPYAPREGGDRKPYAGKPREDGERKPYAPREGGERKSFGDKPGYGERKPYAGKPREDGERKPYAPREGGERKSFGDKPGYGDRKPYSGKPREDGERKPYAPREGGERKSFGDKPGYGDRKPYSGKPREDGERKPYAPRAAAGAEGGAADAGRKPRWGADTPRAGKPAGASGKPAGDRPGFKSAGYKSHGSSAGGGKSAGFKSHGDRPGGKPSGPRPGPKPAPRGRG